ncbi:MAG: MBL fold metallo-hydrolase [Bryobacterales bacterium]|nr:MBL fold metallo-hydrolase [Bryobacterales bacterium]
MAATWFLPLLLAAGLEIRIVYDNAAAEPGLESDWGFAAVVDWNGRRVLFDGGARPEVLRRNLAKMSIPADSLEALVLSHVHTDHSGGLRQESFFRPGVPFFPPAEGAREVLPGIFTTGSVEGTPPEQALVIRTGQGIVVLTGCSHPGVVRMVEAAIRTGERQPVRLLLGGFHMLRQSPAAIGETVRRLRELGVESIAPTHCTGEPAVAAFRKAFGARCLSGGAGKTFKPGTAGM